MTLPPLLAALLAGYLISPHILLPGLLPTAFAATLLLGLAVVAPRRWGGLSAWGGMLLLALVLAETAGRPSGDPQALHRFCGTEQVSLTAEVLALGRGASGTLYLDLESERLVNRGLELAVHGRLRLYVESQELPYAVGDRLVFQVRLRRPQRFETPGEFDYPRYLARRGIHVVAFLKDHHGIARLAVRREPTTVERWREVNAESIVAALSGEPQLAGLVRALAQGEKAGVSPGQRELLAASGLSHLFAISGLHFGLVAAGIYVLGLWLWRRLPWLLQRASPRRLLPLLLVPPLFFYLELSGGAVSSWRAFLALALGALLLASLRRVAPLRLLAAIAFVLLLTDPLLSYEASFQLSFAAAAALLAVMPRLQPWLEGLPAWQRHPAALVAASLTATLATLPLVLLHFRLLAPAGLLANLLGVPLVSLLALPLALAGILLAPWWPALAGLAFKGCGYLLDALLALAEGLLAWPGLAAVEMSLSPAQLVSVAASVGLLFWVVARGPRPYALAFGAAVLVLLLALPDRTPLSLTVFSVGQGEALLLSFEGRRHVLVDAGGLAGSDFDVGERLLVPALTTLGVRQLEAVVLTHAHPDHLLGLATVLERIPARSLWTAVAEGHLPEVVRRLVASGELSLNRPRPGWQTVSEGPLPLRLYAPRDGESENDRSLVTYAACGGEGVLLGGDLERHGVRQLLADPPEGPVTLLKLPHHGSRHSDPGALLAAFSPRLAVASAGKGNPYGLPHDETLACCAAAGVPLWRTDLDGTLRLATDGREWRVTRWKKGRFR